MSASSEVFSPSTIVIINNKISNIMMIRIGFSLYVYPVHNS